MQEYQQRLYESYLSTHVRGRKGVDDHQTLALRGKIWDGSWSSLLPEDRDSRILDAACGNGAMVWWLHQRGFSRASGVDLSGEVIDHGRSLGITNIDVGDLSAALAAHDADLDVVILRDILEHFSKSEVMDVLDLVRNSLREGGRVLIHTPNAESPFFGRIRYGDFTHETAFTPSSLSQVLAATGYDHISFAPSRPVATSLRSRLRVALFRVLEAGYSLFSWAESGKRPAAVTQNLLCVAHRAATN